MAVPRRACYDAHMARSGCAFLVFLAAAVFSDRALATDHPLAGTKLLLRATATKQHLLFMGKQAGLALPLGDPRAVGATLEISNGNGSGETAQIPLPAAGWSVNGASSVYKFASRGALSGLSAVKVAHVGSNKQVKIEAKSTGITLNEPSQGVIVVVLSIGNDRYCARFASPTRDSVGKFVARKQPVAPCPVPQTTTTTNSTTTTTASTTTTAAPTTTTGTAATTTSTTTSTTATTAGPTTTTSTTATTAAPTTSTTQVTTTSTTTTTNGPTSTTHTTTTATTTTTTGPTTSTTHTTTTSTTATTARPTTSTTTTTAGPTTSTTHATTTTTTAGPTTTTTLPSGKIVFVSSIELLGDFTNDDDADDICTGLATTAGLPGTYVAWLSDSFESIVELIIPTTGPYVTRNGLPIAANLADLIDGTLTNGIDRDEKNIAHPGAPVWTGTLPSGAASGLHCEDWSETVGFAGRQGSAGSTNDNWTSFGTGECTTLARLYCFQE